MEETNDKDECIQEIQEEYSAKLMDSEKAINNLNEQIQEIMRILKQRDER